MSTSQPEIFISYNWGKDRKNQRRVLRLKNYLEKHYNVPVWMDTNKILVGSKLGKEIETGIRGCKIFIMCVTAEYATRPNCEKEYTLAVTLGKPILPILFENVSWPPPGLGFHFSDLIYAIASQFIQKK